MPQRPTVIPHATAGTTQGTGHPSRATAWKWLAITAVSALILAVTGSVVRVASLQEQFRLEREGALALSRQAEAARALAERQQKVLSYLDDPEARLVVLTAPGGAWGRVLWSSRGLLLAANGLPPAPDGRIYQLWLATSDGGTLSAGVFQTDPSGAGILEATPPVPPAQVRQILVTLEQGAGEVRPAGDRVLASAPPAAPVPGSPPAARPRRR